MARVPEQKKTLAMNAAQQIESNLTAPPRVGDLAEKAGCSALQLSHAFKKTTGKTIPGYLRARRMDRAAHLLATTRMNVGEVAQLVGYRSLSAFTRGYVREHGRTPHSHRRHRSTKVRLSSVAA